MYETLDKIKSRVIRRAESGIPEFDWLCGYTDHKGIRRWGIPQNAITLISGESGAGKSRILVALASSLSNMGFKILYIQTEYTIDQMASRINSAGVKNGQNFAISDKKSVKDIALICESFRPDFIMIDSVNELEEFGSGTKRCIQEIINGNEEERKVGLRNLCKKYGCHIFLISQLNQNGSIKGSTTLPHLVDIAFNLHKTDCEGLVALAVGVKHRYGRVGKDFFMFWEHKDKTVKCCSEHCTEDPEWIKGH